MAKKTAAKKTTRKPASSARRELVDTGKDKRFVKRSRGGTFKESDDVSRSLKSDRPKKARKTVKAGFGDQGDRRKKR